MKDIMRAGVVLSLALVGCTTVPNRSDETVSLSSLLREMTDADANTYLPKVPFTARLWSSHDRQTTTPDQPGWFANGDANQFIRRDTVDGAVEEVMLDAKGPGAITRFWITVSGTCDRGDIRLYVDGTRVMATNCLAFVSGGCFCPAPLSDSISKETQLGHRGHNLYLPIPYQKSCKVAYVRPAGTKGSFYYNVETRAYAAGTPVESFSMDVVKREKALIDETNRKLAGSRCGTDKPLYAPQTFDCVLAPQGAKRFTLAHPDGGAIRRLAMTVTAEWMPNYLRSTVLEISFDGERTVWVPIGEFFGSGYTYEACTGWFTSCPGTDQFESRWTMPFARTCTVTVHNFGDRTVTLSNTAADWGPYAWDAARSLHFGACWHAYADVMSGAGEGHTEWDYDYAELKGSGFFVGTTLSLWQPVTKWWGEGDEKVFVDGERAPSFIGTGSEDHFGYAWGAPAPYSHPFLMQPIGVGRGRGVLVNQMRRNVVNVRNRALDAIPFTKSLKYDMEMWHWDRNIKIDFAPLACWYMRPGGICNHGPPNLESVTRPVRTGVMAGGPQPRVKLPPSATLFEEFEGDDYGKWKVEGEAFGTGPARGVLPNQNPVEGYSGGGLVNTYLGGDGPFGKLTSPAFTIQRPYVNFLIGGGNYKDETCINLVVDGKVVRTAMGKNNERLEWASWNVADLKGRLAYLEIVDHRKGHFGHINVDCIYFDDVARPK